MKKRDRSPWTTVPAELVKSPSWNQATEFTNWCMPTGIRPRLIRPNSAAPKEPRSVIHSPKLLMPSPMGSHTRPKKTPTRTPTNAMMIGTSRMAVEEAEPVHQPLAVVALPQDGGQQAHDDAAEDAGIVVRGRYVGACLNLGLGDREGLEHVAVDQKADHPGERGRAVGLLGEADRDADAEQQRQVVEHGAAAWSRTPTRPCPSRGRPRRTRQAGRDGAECPPCGRTAIGSCRLRPTFCRPWKRPEPRFFAAGAADAVAVVMGVLLV